MLNNDFIRLRAVEPADVEFLFETENDTSLWKVSETQVPFSRSTMKKYAESVHDLNQQGQFRYIVERIEDNKRLGMIDLFDYNAMNNRVGVGIVVLPEYQNSGVASAALELLINYAKSHLVLKQVHCSIQANNDNSIRLFEKQGFVKVGERKQWYRTANGWEDELLFQLILT